MNNYITATDIGPGDLAQGDGAYLLNIGDDDYPVRFWNGEDMTVTNCKFYLDKDGNVFISGTLSAGEIHIPNETDDGFHVESDGTVRIGDPTTGQRFEITPSALGQLTAYDATNARNGMLSLGDSAVLLSTDIGILTQENVLLSLVPGGTGGWSVSWMRAAGDQTGLDVYHTGGRYRLAFTSTGASASPLSLYLAGGGFTAWELQHTGNGQVTLPASNNLLITDVPAGTASVSTANSGGTSGSKPALVDHVHNHASGYLPNAHHDEVHTHTHASATGQTANDHHNQAHSDSDHTNTTRSFFVAVNDMTLDSGTLTTQGTAPNSIAVIELADALTQGAFFTTQIPDDADDATNMQIGIRYSSSGSGAAQTIRWSVNALAPGVGEDASGTGTTTGFTGNSVARTANFHYLEVLTDIGVVGTARRTLRCNVRRVGANAADTFTGTVRLIGVEFRYTAVR